MKKKILPRCAAVTRDGSPCGRRVKDGSQPPLCHLHKPGATVPNTFQPAERSPLEIIQKLMNDSDPSIRLRAVDMYQKYEEKKGCATCAARESESQNNDDLFGRATPAQLVEFGALVAECKATYAKFNALRNLVRAQPLRDFDPETPPPHVIERWREEDGTEQQHAKSTRTAREVSAAPREHAADSAAEADNPEPEAVATLSRDLWDSVGLFEQNDVVTHAYGDEHAAKVLSGEIPLEQAQAEQADAMAKLNRMGGSTTNSKLTW